MDTRAAGIILRIYVLFVALASVLGLLYIYLNPPPSMRAARDGVAHFTPTVLHTETGEPVQLGTLIRHYRGD